MYTVYSKFGCPFCEKIKNILNLAYQSERGNSTYAYVDNLTILQLGVDFTKEEFYKKFGNGSTFPQVILNEDSAESIKLGGCMDTVKYLKENNII